MHQSSGLGLTHMNLKVLQCVNESNMIVLKEIWKCRAIWQRVLWMREQSGNGRCGCSNSCDFGSFGCVNELGIYNKIVC